MWLSEQISIALEMGKEKVSQFLQCFWVEKLMEMKCEGLINWVKEKILGWPGYFYNPSVQQQPGSINTVLSLQAYTWLKHLSYIQESNKKSHQEWFWPENWHSPWHFLELLGSHKALFKLPKPLFNLTNLSNINWTCLFFLWGKKNIKIFFIALSWHS